MPMRPPRACSSPGCPDYAVVGGRCSRCARAPRPDRRPSAARRGYDAGWRALRAEVLSERRWCRCGRRATVVDHRDGDVRNVARSNLEAMCSTCHGQKTARHDGSFGRPVRRLR